MSNEVGEVEVGVVVAVVVVVVVEVVVVVVVVVEVLEVLFSGMAAGNGGRSFEHLCVNRHPMTQSCVLQGGPLLLINGVITCYKPCKWPYKWVTWVIITLGLQEGFQIIWIFSAKIEGMDIMGYRSSVTRFIT